MWNGFWSHNYNSFDQIDPPLQKGESNTMGLILAWKRFITDSHISFFENEIAPLREITPDIPVTTNFMRRYKSDFYNGMPCVTENAFGKGKAYYTAFRSDKDFADDFCKMLVKSNSVVPDANVVYGEGIFLRKCGNNIFVMNFADDESGIVLDKEYTNVITSETVCGRITLPVCGYIVIK